MQHIRMANYSEIKYLWLKTCFRFSMSLVLSKAISNIPLTFPLVEFAFCTWRKEYITQVVEMYIVQCASCIVHWRHSFLQEICWLIEYILLCFIIFIHLFYLFIILYLSSLCVCLSIQNTLHKHKAGFTYSQEWLISFTLRWTSINVILQLVFYFIK